MGAFVCVHVCVHACGSLYIVLFQLPVCNAHTIYIYIYVTATMNFIL